MISETSMPGLPPKQGLYDPAHEKDSCGIGFVDNIKGQNSRSGKGVRLGFEGGQMPIIRRMHTLRGFNNKWRVAYQPVNVAALDRFEAGAAVTPESLRQAGILKHLREPVKLLGQGDLAKPLTVSAHAFSASAKSKIEQAGGTVLVIGADEAGTDE